MNFKEGQEVWVKAVIDCVNDRDTVDLIIEDDTGVEECLYDIPKSSIVVEKPRGISGRVNLVYDFDTNEVVELVPINNSQIEKNKLGYKVVGKDSNCNEHIFATFLSEEQAYQIVHDYEEKFGRGVYVEALNWKNIKNLYVSSIKK